MRAHRKSHRARQASGANIEVVRPLARCLLQTAPKVARESSVRSQPGHCVRHAPFRVILLGLPRVPQALKVPSRDTSGTSTSQQSLARITLKGCLGHSARTVQQLFVAFQGADDAVLEPLALELRPSRTTTYVGLYVRRLICLNGMTNDTQAFHWNARVSLVIPLRQMSRRTYNPT